MPLKNYNTSNSSGFENHKRHGHSVGLSFEDSEKTVKSMDSGLVDPPNSFPAFTPPGRSWEEPGLLSSQNNSSHRHNRPFSVLSYSSMLSNPVSPSPTNKIPSLANHTMGLMNRASNLSGIPTTKRSSRWTVVVIPPLLLPHSPPPPHVSGFAHGYGASGRYDSGLLLPLQPTMTLQLASIAREFSLPSTGGLTLHLCMIPVTESSQPGPRVTDDSWAVLFGWAFEESNSSGPSGLLSSTGLPIAARLEFDIDLRKARWFDAWASTSQPAGAPRQVLRSRQSLQLSTSIPPLRHGNKTEQPLRSDSSSGTSGARSLKSSFIRKQSFVPSSTSPEIEANDKYRLSHASGIAVGPMDERYDQDKLSEVSEDLKSLNNHSSEENRNLVESPECRTLASGRESFDSGRTKSQQIDESARLELEKRLQFELEQEESEHQVMEAQRRNQMELEYQAQQERLRVEAEQEAKDAEDRRLETELQNEERKLAQEREKNDETRLELLGEVDEEVEMEWEEEERMKLELEKLEVQNKKLEEMEKQKDAERKEEQRFRVEQERLEAEKKAAEESEKQREAERQEEERLRLEQEKLEAEKNAAEELKKLEEAQRQEEEQLRLEQERFDAEKRAAEEMEHQKEEQRQEDEQLRLEQERFDAEKKAAEEIEHQKEAQRQEEERLRQELEKLEVEKKAAEELEKEAERLRQQVLSASDKATENQKVLQFSNLSRANEKAVHELEETAAEVKDGNTQSEKAIETVVEKNNTPSVADLSVDDKKPATEAENLSSSIKIGSVTSSPKEKVLKSKPSFSSSLGRAFGLFSGGFDSGKSDSSKDKDKEALSLQEEAERAVNEKALAKVASIMSNPSQRTSFDDEPLPPVKESPKAPPPPRTRDKVIHMAKAFESAENTPSSSHFSPNQQTSNQISEHLLPERQQLLLNNLAPVAAIDPSVPLLYEYSDHSRLSEDLSEYIVQSQEQAISRHQKFVIAISGGSLPKLLTDGLLKNSRVKWESWKVFFADERVVPLEHADSNFASAMDCFLSKAPIKRSQIISIMSLPPEDVDFADMTPMISSIYEAQILDELETNATDPIPRFDLILLGMGEDGHTCSLFPSHPLLEGRTDATVAWIDDSPKPPKYRITLTLPVINAAHDLAFVCTGGGKSSMLAAVLEEEQSNVRPASLIRLKDRPLAWFVDCDAASKTTHRREDWGKTSVGLLSTLNFSPPKKISEQVITRDQDIETSEEISNSKMISETQEPAAEALALKPNTMEPASSASELSSMASPKEIQDLSSPETKAGLSKEQGGFNISKFALGLNTGLGGFKISNFALGFNSSQADLKTTKSPVGLNKDLDGCKISKSPVGLNEDLDGSKISKSPVGLNEDLDGSKISKSPVGLNEDLDGSETSKSPVGLNEDLGGSKISKSTVGLNEDLDGSKISTLEVNEGGDEIQHKVESKEALHSNDSVIALGSIKDMSANTEERKFAFTESLILDEKKQLLFISVDSIPGYPFNLRVYPAVYPHIDELLYCAPVPSSIKKAESALNMRMVSQLDLGCIEEKQERELRAGLLGDDSVSVSLPKSTDVIPGVYSSLKKSGSESGLHQNISDRSSDDSTDTQKKTARASKHIPAPLQPFSAKEPQSPPPPESSWTERLLKSPVSIENSSLSPSFYRSGSPSSAGRIISISPSLQYTQQPRSNDSEMVTSGGSGLEIKAFGLGASFFKPKDNLVDPEAEGLTEAVEADKRSETSSFSKSESMDTDCVNSRQLTEEDWPPTPTSLSRFPGDGPSKNGEFRATPLNSISPRDASSVDYCESGRAYIESDHEIRIKPLSEASAITPTIAEFHEAAKRDNCAQASSVSEKFYSGEETPRSNTICADEFEESLTRGTRMVFSQQTNVESYPTGYLNSLGIQLSGPTIQTDHDIRQVSLAEASAISPTIASFHADLKVWPEASNLEAERKMPPATGHSIEKLFVAEDSAPTPKLTNQMRTLKEMDSIDPAVEPISPPRQPSPDLSQRLESAEAGGDASSQFPGYEKMDSISSNSEVSPIRVDTTIQTVSLASASEISPSIAKFHNKMEDTNLVNPAKNLDEIEVLNVVASQLSLEDKQSNDAVVASHQEAEASDYSGSTSSLESFTSDRLMENLVAEDSALTPTLTNQMRTLKEMDSIDPAVEPISPPRQPSPDLSQRLESAEAGGDASIQFPGYEKMDPMSPNFEVPPIRVDTTIQTVSLANASEISPSIAKFHNKMEDTNLVNPAKNLDEIEVLNVVASQLSLEDKQSNDAVVASHQEIEISDSSDSISSLESSAVAISTDDPEASPHPRRHPILSEDSKFDGISKRLSLLRLSSPGIPIISPSGDLNSSNIPIEIPLQVNMNGSHSESSASDDFEGSSTEIPISQADNEFDLNRLHEITGQPLLTLSSAGSSSEHEMDWTIPTDVPSGIDISLPFDRLPPVLESGEEVNITSEGDVQVSAAPAPPSPILFTFPDQAEVSEALGQFVYEAQEAAFQRHGKFQIALSGNTLPIVLADAVIEDERVKWDRWEVFLVDEAVAPMGSSQSAFSNLTKMILEHVPVPAGQIHSIVELSSDDIEEAKQIADGLDTMTDSLADDYENELLACFPEASHETGQAPKFDLILVEVGDQGQVGGLYPGHPLLGESDWFVAWLGDATEPFTHRITLTLPVFNSAYQLAFLAIGKNIASVLSDALDRTIQSDVPMDEDRVNPAALVKTDKRPIVWFADLEASSSTDYPRSAFWDED